MNFERFHSSSDINLDIMYKSKYLSLKQSIESKQIGGASKHSKKKSLKKFNNMIGGYKPYIDALEEIFSTFASDNPEHSLEKDTELCVL